MPTSCLVLFAAGRYGRSGLRANLQVTERAPSMNSTWPEMYAPAGEASRIAAPTTSSGSARRPAGVLAIRVFSRSGSPQKSLEKAVRTIDGAIALARTFDAPHSTAMLRTIPFSADFAAPYAPKFGLARPESMLHSLAILP